MRAGVAGSMLLINLDSFAVAARWNRLPASLNPLDLARTASDPAFPGALLPAVGPDDSQYWYGAAATGVEWRLLQPLILAFAGPTVTNFGGQATPLDVTVPAERLLLDSGVYAAARLVPGDACVTFAARALERLRQAVALRPSGSPAAPEPTSRLLASLDMCLAVGDRVGARVLFEALRAEFRLDTLNLHYLEVRIFSTFRDWRELVSMEWFAELSVARKPSAVASAMLEALWQAYLKDVADDPDELAHRYRELVRPFALPLLAQVSTGVDDFSARLRSLEAAPTAVMLTPGAAAQDLLDRAAEAPSTRRIAEARSAISALPQEDRETILQSGAGQRAIAEITPLEGPAPASWTEWLQLLPDPRFTAAVDVAREGVSQWTSAQLLAREQAAALAEGFLRVGVSEEIGRTRLFESLPSLIRWVKEDPDYPRRPLRDVYEALLQLFSLLEYQGGAERNAAADLLDATLSLGTTAEGYRQLLGDFATLIDRGAGDSSIYWLIDVAEILLHYPTPDPPARLTILNNILDSLQPLLLLLSPGQRASYNRVAVAASWPSLPPPVQPHKVTGFEYLRRKSVAIYTLTESAARQAEAALKEIEPTLEIELAHDHVASARLIRLAREADIFVLVAASAKHAATDCILTHRGDRPLLYAPGRGFSSIVRALEDYAPSAVGAPALN
jgi:hypothetical protein